MLRLIASTVVLATALTGIARAADTDDWLGDVRQLLPACKAAEYPDQIHSLLIAFKAGACVFRRSRPPVPIEAGRGFR
jgi:hypothetical protein